MEYIYKENVYKFCQKNGINIESNQNNIKFSKGKGFISYPLKWLNSKREDFIMEMLYNYFK